MYSMCVFYNQNTLISEVCLGLTQPTNIYKQSLVKTNFRDAPRQVCNRLKHLV